jgi:hypothetical protein
MKDGRQAMVENLSTKIPSDLNPELVYVVGGYHLELQGFCPWIIALTEFWYIFLIFSHIPFLDHRFSVNYRELRRGLVHFAKVQQRCGK